MLRPSLFKLVRVSNDYLQQHLPRLFPVIVVTGDIVPTIVFGWIVMLRSDVFSTCTTADNNVLLRWRTACFLRTGAYYFFIFEPLGGFDPPMAQIKGITSVITEMHCSVEGEMSTNSSSKMHLGAIVVHSAVRRNCGKVRGNALTVLQTGGLS